MTFCWNPKCNHRECELHFENIKDNMGYIEFKEMGAECELYKSDLSVTDTVQSDGLDT